MSRYDDIINLPHYELKHHKRMSMESRSAQFAPFAALTGYNDGIVETGRITSKKIILTDDEKNILDRKLKIAISSNSLIKIKYFVPDKSKMGGKYIFETGYVKKINSNLKEIVLTNNVRIKICNIVDIILDWHLLYKNSR